MKIDVITMIIMATAEFLQLKKIGRQVHILGLLFYNGFCINNFQESQE